MKTQLMCVMVVVFATTSYGTRFNCADQKNCDKCPPVNKHCRNLRKCGCCHICRDKLNPAFMRKMLAKYQSTSRSDPWEKNPDVNCANGVCHCLYEGQKLRHYLNFWAADANMDSCKCANVLEKAARTGHPLGYMYHCNKHGNYPKMYCIGPFCYCMKTNGALYGNPFSRLVYNKEMSRTSLPTMYALCPTTTFTG